MSTREVIREVIQRVLREHVDEPFLLLREAGLQARIWCLLRQKLDPEVVNSQVKSKSRLHHHAEEFKTSRVQLELKVGGKKRSDIVVLRAGCRPRLTCACNGATDVLAMINPADVEAVIEIKAAPSRGRKQPKRFRHDIMKLRKLRKNHPEVQCYFVLFDKSLPVPGAACDISEPRMRNGILNYS